MLTPQINRGNINKLSDDSENNLILVFENWTEIKWQFFTE